MFRNELFRVLDNPEKEKQGFSTGQRNPNSLGPVLKNFTAASTSSSSLYVYLANRSVQVCCVLISLCAHSWLTPVCDQARDEKTSQEHFKKAQGLVGTREWEKFAYDTGFKGQMVSEMGSEMYGITEDPTQNQWRRLDYCRSHLLGIVDNTFRSFLLSLITTAQRKEILARYQLVRQPPGQGVGRATPTLFVFVS